MNRIQLFTRRLLLPAAAVALAVVISSSGAGSPPSNPTVDLSVGPVAINAQAVNIALALSVEFPTVGAAYREPDYDHATTYLGHFDATGCYAYKDNTTGAPLSGEYFYRTGSVDGSGYCESSTGKYSGNLLNYVTTSSIDLLRYALTGGNRVVDTADTTVLERAYLRDVWNLNNSNFPSKRIPAALVGKVIPLMYTATGQHLGDVNAGGCWDRVYFGTSNASVGCDNAANTTSGNLNRRVPNPSSLQTGKVLFGQAVPTTAISPTLGTVTWEISSPLRTATVAPSDGSPTTNTFVYYQSVGGTTTTWPVPSGSGLSSATVSLTYIEVSGGKVATPVAISTYPTEGPTPNRSVIGNNTNTTGYGIFSTSDPGVDGNGLDLASSFTLVNNSGTNRNRKVCQNGSNVVGRTNNGNPTDTGVDQSWCDTNFPGSSQTSLRTAKGWSGSNNNSQSVTLFTVYKLVPYYQQYTIQRNIQNWQALTGWRVYDQWQYYTFYSTTLAVPMYARTKVCDSSEATTRTDLCRRYPSGNYKPAGEIQRYATGVRVAAFGYLKDDNITTYGGVLRAPMKYPGPIYTDQNGQPQDNATSEWNGDTGIFTTDPLAASPTYPMSGVINYLNKFGTANTAALGYYKTYDPVGELYYEALRYFQGLQPTPGAISPFTADTATADGFPVYTTWTDPVQNACERRNFILTIGDVNTHVDKQLPGHRVNSGGVNNTGNGDTTRAVETIPGSSPTAAFNAVDWTKLLAKFETNSSGSYTDSLGRTQSTLGNPNPYADNSNLDTKCTGATCAGYYWAGAAYWANTQPIRQDSKGGQSMKDIRVKTFTIDVDEYGTGSIEDDNTRGIKPRASSFYLAGKYGWFNDANLDGSPFKTSGDIYNNSEWEDIKAPNTPDGYVIASQAQKLIDGIRKFFKAASSERGSVSVSAISSARFTSDSPNGDFFAPQFNAGDWSGTVQRSKLVLNTTTGTVESTSDIIWDAGAILSAAALATSTVADPYVKPADRNIITLSTDGGTSVGVVFNVASKGSLDSAVQAALGTNPSTNATDSLADQRINWLRGSHADELTSTGGSFRQRSSIMGDVINSGPVYKQAADPNLSGTGYLAFAQSVKNRGAVVYVGANDGMMHAFRADDGKELFAYIPRAIATQLNKLTHPNYVHRPYADGVPMVNEAQVGSSWKTLLVSGMGGGAQGIFALDVTDPTTFGTDKVMFEFTDADDAAMGNVLTQPVLVKLKIPGTIPSYKWFIAVGSGYNNYKPDDHTSSTGSQAMFFLSVDKQAGDTWQEGTNYYKVEIPVASTTTVNGMVNPGFYVGPNGEAKLLYAGDLQGNVWKFDLSDGINSANIADAVRVSGGAKVPLFVAMDAANVRQPITTSPQIVDALGSGYMVIFGSGKFVEPSDSATAQSQSIYGIWDSLESNVTDFTVPKNKLYQRSATLNGTAVTLSTTTFTFGKSTGQSRGWYFNLPETRERVSVESALGIGAVVFAAAIPEGSCSGDGTGRKYCLNPIYGTSVCGISVSSPGIPSGPKIFQIELDDSSYTARSPTGRRSVSIEQQAITSSTKITDAGNALVDGKKLQSIIIPAGRMNWRELRN